MNVKITSLQTTLKTVFGGCTTDIFGEKVLSEHIEYLLFSYTNFVSSLRSQFSLRHRR